MRVRKGGLEQTDWVYLHHCRLHVAALCFGSFKPSVQNISESQPTLGFDEDLHSLLSTQTCERGWRGPEYSTSALAVGAS